MITSLKLSAILRRELPKSAAGAVAASLLPTLLLGQVSADTMCPVLKTVEAMAPKVFINAVLSTLIPLIGLLQLYRCQFPTFRLRPSCAVRALIVIGATAGVTTILVVATILLVAHELGLALVTEAGARHILVAQAVIVAVALSTATIVSTMRRWEHPSDVAPLGQM